MLALENINTLRSMAERDHSGVALHHLIVLVNFAESTPAQPQTISLKNLHRYDPERKVIADRDNNFNPTLLSAVNALGGKSLVFMTELAYNWGETRISIGILNRPGFWDVRSPSTEQKKAWFVTVGGKEYDVIKDEDTIIIGRRP
jgi:hypothetical protein